MTASPKRKHLGWQVTVEQVYDPESVESGEQLMLELALKCLRKAARDQPEGKM